MDLVCAISSGGGSPLRLLMPELCKVPEAVTPPAYFVGQQNSIGTRSVKALTRLWKPADVVRKRKQEGHKNHENTQNLKKKKTQIKKKNLKIAGRLLLKPKQETRTCAFKVRVEEGQRDMHTATFLPCKTLTWRGGPQVPKSVLLIQLWVQWREALEGAQQKKREAAASYTELYSVGWEQLRQPSSKLN